MLTTHPLEHDADFIRARYGGSARSTSNVLKWAAIVVGIIGLGVFIWIGIGLAKPEATSNVISFDVVDPGVTTLHFEVSKPEEETAECTLEALSTSFAQVGVKTVTVGPAETSTVTLFEEINTSEIATTAGVKSCTLVD